MNVDLDTQIRNLYEQVEARQEPVTLDEIQTTGKVPVVGPKTPPRRLLWQRGWVVALATAAAVLLAGLVVLFAQQSGGEGQPFIEEPPPTTVIEGVGGWSLVPVEGETLAGADIRSVILTSDGLIAVGLQNTNLVTPGATSTTAPGAGGGLRPGVWLSEDGVAWTRVPPRAFTGVGVGGIFDVAEGESGLVAVGQVGCAATVWVSEDGLSWSQVPYDESVFAGSLGTAAGGACSWIDRVVAGPSGFVALGGGFGSGESFSISPRLWTSPDGLSWTPLTQEDAGFGDRFLQITHLVSGRAGWVAFGGSCTETPQEALELFESEELQPNCPVAIWTSSDGTIWEEVPHDEEVFGGTGTEIRSVTQSPNGLIAAGRTVDGVTIWSSVDGRVWERTPVSGSAFGGDLPEFFVGDAQGLVAVALFDQTCVPIESEEQAALARHWGCELQDGSSGIHQSEAQVWTSPDGAIWTPSPSDVKVPGFAFADAAVKFQSGLIVAATDTEPTSHQVLLRWTPGQPVPHPQVPAMYRAVAEFVLAAEIDHSEESSPDEGFVLLTDRPVVYVLDHPEDVDMFNCEGESSPGGAFECVPIPELSDTAGGEIQHDVSLTGERSFSDTVVRQIEAGLSGVNTVFVADRDEVLGDYVRGGRPVANDGALLRFGQIYANAEKRLMTVRCLGCVGLFQDRLLVLELVDGHWIVQVDGLRHFD